jgi:magnesium transporter
MLIDAAHYVLGLRQHDEPISLEQAAGCPRKGSSFVWISLHEPADATMRELQDRFALHELAVEDAAHAHQRPKIEQYDSFHYIVFRTAHFDDARRAVEFGEIHLFVAPGYVVSVRHGGSRAGLRARARLERRPGLMKSGPAAVVWGVLDEVVDEYRPVAEALEAGIEEIEGAVFSGGADQTEAIYQLKLQVSAFYRAVHPLLAPLDALERGTSFLEIDPGLKRYFRDVNDHLKLVNEEALAQREQLVSVLDANVSLMNARQNEVAVRQNRTITQLTVLASVFLPLTFVTGFFGQNFGWLVDHIHSFAAFLILGLGFLVAPLALLYVWLRHGKIAL